MDEIRAWWEIAELAGAGAALVLGIVVWKLWHRNEENENYLREADKNTLNVLHELSKTLEDRERSIEGSNRDIVGAIDSQKDTLVRAIDDAKTHITTHIDQKLQDK